jgi:hypothetical protein
MGGLVMKPIDESVLACGIKRADGELYGVTHDGVWAWKRDKSGAPVGEPILVREHCCRSRPLRGSSRLPFTLREVQGAGRHQDRDLASVSRAMYKRAQGAGAQA